MSATTSTARLPRAHASVEQHCCAQCREPVDPTDVDVHQPRTLTRRVRAYCDHCNITTVAHYELNGGSWSLAGRIEKLKGNRLDARQKDAA